MVWWVARSTSQVDIMPLWLPMLHLYIFMINPIVLTMTTAEVIKIQISGNKMLLKNAPEGERLDR